jgi:DNA-binding Xre family transcriptional regulator
MIRYNFDRIFKARGIERPFTFLRKAGFSDNFATKINQNKVKRLNLEEIERLCVLLKCTPNDFFEWTPDSDNQVNEDHPLNDIRRSDIVIDITKTLNSVPLGQLAEIEQMIKDKIN